MITSNSRRVLAICIDGYENTLGEAMMRDGDLPTLQRLTQTSARFLLDHDPAQRTGLAGEHFSTGLSPEQGRRWSGVVFDPSSYRVWQEGTSLTPFPAMLSTKTVVLDATYFDLDRAPAVEGIVSWGAHDPGVETASRPLSLQDEVREKFGDYPAMRWLYATPWNSTEDCIEMGERLSQGVEVRSQVARWLFGERLPNWDLGIIVLSELHSGNEGLWHGIDLNELEGVPSSSAAGEALKKVYRAADRLLADLLEAFPDAQTMVYTMGGMGPNQSDVASMALLPELLYRDSFGHPHLQPRSDWADALVPMLLPGEHWSGAVNDLIPGNKVATARRLMAPRLTELKHRLGFNETGPMKNSIEWMAATLYQPYWKRMAAFALPSFYDGRIRLNLAGREKNGRVALGDYEATISRLETLVDECRDCVTGEPVVASFERAEGDPLSLPETQADLTIVWRSANTGFDHPQLGRIGPLPVRRTGGHTGPHGVAFISGSSLEPGLHGEVSAFDLVPTLISMLGEPVPPHLTGRSLLEKTAAPSQ